MNAANLMMVNVQPADAAVRAEASSGKTAAKSEGFGGGKQQKAFEELFAQAKTEAEAPTAEESPDVAAQQAAGFNPLAVLVELTARSAISPEPGAADGVCVNAAGETPIAAAGNTAGDFALTLKARLAAAEQTPDIAAAKLGETSVEPGRDGAAQVLTAKTDDAALSLPSQTDDAAAMLQKLVSPHMAEQPLRENATPVTAKPTAGLNWAAALAPSAAETAETFPEQAETALFSSAAIVADDELTAQPSPALSAARQTANVMPDAAELASEPVRAAVSEPGFAAQTDSGSAVVATSLPRVSAAVGSHERIGQPEQAEPPLSAATSQEAATAETLLRLLDGQTAAVSLAARRTEGKTAAVTAEQIEAAALDSETTAELSTDGAELSIKAPRQDAAQRTVSFDARQPQPNLNATASGAAAIANEADADETLDAARSLTPTLAEQTATQPKLAAKSPVNTPFKAAEPAVDAAEAKQPVLTAGTANAAAAADRAEAAAGAPRTAAQYNIAEQIVEKAHLIKTDQDTQMIIKLKPEHLGELSLKITVENGAVSASFHSDNAQVRAALETSLLQLKQELAAQGVKVDNVGVYAGMGDLLSNGQGGQAGREQQSARYKNRKIDLADFEDEVDKVGIVAENKASETGVDYRI